MMDQTWHKFMHCHISSQKICAIFYVRFTIHISYFELFSVQHANIVQTHYISLFMTIITPITICKLLRAQCKTTITITMLHQFNRPYSRRLGQACTKFTNHSGGVLLQQEAMAVAVVSVTVKIQTLQIS